MTDRTDKEGDRRRDARHPETPGNVTSASQDALDSAEEVFADSPPGETLQRTRVGAYEMSPAVAEPAEPLGAPGSVASPGTSTPSTAQQTSRTRDRFTSARPRGSRGPQGTYPGYPGRVSSRENAANNMTPASAIDRTNNHPRVRSSQQAVSSSRRVSSRDQHVATSLGAAFPKSQAKVPRITLDSSGTGRGFSREHSIETTLGVAVPRTEPSRGQSAGATRGMTSSSPARGSQSTVDSAGAGRAFSRDHSTETTLGVIVPKPQATVSRTAGDSTGAGGASARDTLVDAGATPKAAELPTTLSGPRTATASFQSVRSSRPRSAQSGQPAASRQTTSSVNVEPDWDTLFEGNIAKDTATGGASPAGSTALTSVASPLLRPPQSSQGEVAAPAHSAHALPDLSRKSMTEIVAMLSDIAIVTTSAGGTVGARSPVDPVDQARPMAEPGVGDGAGGTTAPAERTPSSRRPSNVSAGAGDRPSRGQVGRRRGSATRGKSAENAAVREVQDHAQQGKTLGAAREKSPTKIDAAKVGIGGTGDHPKFETLGSTKTTPAAKTPAWSPSWTPKTKSTTPRPASSLSLLGAEQVPQVQQVQREGGDVPAAAASLNASERKEQEGAGQGQTPPPRTEERVELRKQKSAVFSVKRPPLPVSRMRPRMRGPQAPPVANIEEILPKGLMNLLAKLQNQCDLGVMAQYAATLVRHRSLTTALRQLQAQGGHGQQKAQRSPWPGLAPPQHPAPAQKPLTREGPAEPTQPAQPKTDVSQKALQVSSPRPVLHNVLPVMGTRPLQTKWRRGIGLLPFLMPKPKARPPPTLPPPHHPSNVYLVEQCLLDALERGLGLEGEAPASDTAFRLEPQVQYDSRWAADACRILAAYITQTSKALDLKRYKTACVVRIIEKQNQGFCCHFSALWDSHSDCYCSAIYETNTFVAHALFIMTYWD